MRLFRCAVLVGLLSSLSASAWAAPALVSGSHNALRNVESASARTLAYGGNLTSGSLLVVFVATYDVGITVTVSDGTNGAYTQAGSYSVAADTGVRASLWYFQNNAATGTPTVTVTPSALAYLSMSVDEFTGVATTSALRATANSTGTSNTHVSGTVTATAGDLVFVGMSAASTVAVTSVDSPFTILTMLVGSGTLQGIHTAYHLTAAGNEAATFNFASGVSASEVIASFAPPSGGAATSTAGTLLGVGK